MTTEDRIKELRNAVCDATAENKEESAFLFGVQFAALYITGADYVDSFDIPDSLKNIIETIKSK